ncbi:MULTISPECIES: membrane protein insertion efficiency factor YidD [Leptospira]|uniref:Putative membrane protein insertion efficiency factor n=5 Tax=Leptospira borgpetersenii TaxID=174 RepID=M3GEU0_LEPBO|nr:MULTISPECIES: membrane protein insertion efficiency factor YidD [Leptospira]EMF99456.1 putative membrane protein insertion efficiency factor [Leptospira borgpetersenii str. 200701203]EMO11408.1 putative membrane protein insertion efficiency factor [Leptospira borgpetersenii str. Noumea 25]ALO24544.1 putative membrane protein insertion efficiency factor [Leptospira borgpetersenii serovar Ballum]ANG99686.1 Putative membrane protein insertion efficiency factor [Leptospira borgpetersenii str. 4E
MNQLVIQLIQLYKKIISPLLPPACRFTPTCSEYTIQAFREYGFFQAIQLSAWRILRCNPLSQGFEDPLPPNTKRTNLTHGRQTK